MRRLKILTLACLAAACCLVMAQAPQRPKPKEESLLRLVSADRAQQMTEGPISFRIVNGNARFLHNDTYLLCDSAAWNVSSQIIEAYGHVKVIQDRTMLTSDQMVYLINDNTATFSGTLVELTDKDGNRLRTKRLDYNTKDSTAVFERGAAMKDKSGNVIESINGTYDSKVKTFTFEDRVEIYMDSIFMKTDKMTYLSNEDKAVFGEHTFAWKEDNFIRSEAGFYNKKDSTLQFSKDVYVNSKDYEAWSEEAYFYRPRNEVEMFDNVRILDTMDRMVLFGNHARYERDSSRAYLMRDPSVIYYGENENHEVDTLFTRADTMVFWTVPMCDFTSEQIEVARKHREDALFDALQELRTKQAEERAKQLEERLRAAGKLPPLPAANDSTAAPKDSIAAPTDSTLLPPPVLNKPSRKAAADSLAAAPSDDPAVSSDTPAAPTDTLAAAAPTDSLAAAADSLATGPKDSTLVKCFRGFNHCKVYRTDVQFCCDSMYFTELDSIAVLYGRPILWNNVKNQLTSETMHLLFKDGNMHRGSMLTDARITSMEDTTHFNQIRSTEMMGFFADNQLYRYDALGGVSAIFYMKKDSSISNVNVKTSKSLTAVIEKGDAKKMLYLEEVKSDAYPLAEIEMDKQRLKGFEWRPDERPVDRYAVTEMQMPESIRDNYKDLSKPDYIYTDRYFDKYMRNVYKKIREDEQKRRAEQREKQRIKDSIAVADSLAMAEVAMADSLRVADSLATIAAVADSTDSTIEKANLTRKELSKDSKDTEISDRKLSWKERRAIRKAERKARREARRAARKARKAARRIHDKELQVIEQDTQV
ncbi:MAG: hypothetical protein MJY60_07370 [Bacteroidales bacterium]|nr:hypothetical protein [Bacteroidales bacterium]